MHPEALSEKNQETFIRLKSFPEFYLAGGTALALQIGHRKSIDFDLFSSGEISKDLFTQVKRSFADKIVDLSVNNQDELTVFIDNTKITFLKYPFTILLDLIDHEGVKLLNVKEIAATKAYAIGRRGSFKDYVDLYFVILEGHSSLSEIVEMAEKKYSNEFKARLFLEQLIYLEDIEEEDIIFLKKKVGKDEIKNLLETEVKKIKL